MRKDLIKKDNGITLIALVITVIVLSIMITIVIRYGSESIENANIQNMQTNMLLIEAKAKGFVENANYNLGVKPEEATSEMKQKSLSELEGTGKGTKVIDGDEIIDKVSSITGLSNSEIVSGNVYKLSTQDLEAMGISGVESNQENGWYFIVYDITNASAKIYNTLGIKINKTETKYCLDDIRNIEFE